VAEADEVAIVGNIAIFR